MTRRYKDEAEAIRNLPLSTLLEHARRQRDRARTDEPEATRFRFSEANHLAQLDAVVDWLERAPLTSWFDEYLETGERP